MKINYQFKDNGLVERALTHPSLSGRPGVRDYQQLEFLGDAIVNMMIAEELHRIYPDAEEGDLSKMHANLVRTETLARVAEAIGIGFEIKMDQGEELHGGRSNPANLEDCLEALIAAVFLDSDYTVTKRVFLPFWYELLSDAEFLMRRDPRTVLQEWSQSKKLGLPQYVLLSEKGAAHQPLFTIVVQVQGFEGVEGVGTSIKRAKGAAAENFIARYSIGS